MSNGNTENKKITLRVVSAETLYRDPEGTLVRVKSGDVLFITISLNTPLRKLKDRYCLTNAVERTSVAFCFAGCLIEEDDSAEKLKMRDGDTISVKMRDDYLLKEETSSTLQQEYLSLLDDDAMADVELLVGPLRKSIKVHRAIVCVRNAHFRSQMTFPGVESARLQVEMPDCDPQLMKYLLQYIYAEKVTIPEDPNDALELLCLADKYLCGGLKERIEFAMIGRTTVDNVIQILCAAYMQNTERLRKHCRQFVMKHWPEIPHLELLEGFPNVMFDITETAVAAHLEREQTLHPVDPQEHLSKRRKVELTRTDPTSAP